MNRILVFITRHIKQIIKAVKLPKGEPLRMWQYALLAMCTVGLIFAIFAILQRAIFELQGAYNSDSLVYWAVAKALLNGQDLYTEIFDLRPPGIYILSALSFYIFNSPFICHLAQAFVIVAFPIPVYLMLKGNSIQIKITSLLFAFAFVFFIAEHAGKFQTESFCVFFSITYVLFAIRLLNKPTIARYLFAGIFLALAAGFKETFLIACFAAAVALSDSFKIFTRIFLMPLVLAVSIGIVAMAIMGHLVPYITIYLEYLLRVEARRYGSLVSRIPQFISSGWGHITINIWMTALALSIAALLVCLLFEISLLKNSRRKLSLIVALILSTGIAILSVLLRGVFIGQYYILLIPLLCALLFKFVLLLPYAGSRLRTIFISVITVPIVVAVALFSPQYNYQESLSDLKHKETIGKEDAKIIDDIMDLCNIEKYFNAGAHTYLAGYTKHSPIGQIFIDNEFFFFYKPFEISYLKGIEQAKIIAITDNYNWHIYNSDGDKWHGYRLAREYISAFFTHEPPPCASKINSRPTRFKILYRK